MQKSLIILTITFLCQVALHGQEINLIATDSTWVKEHFTFPLSFAQRIDFQGVEEAVFPRGWADVDSHEFWSYAFAWKIDADKALKENEMEISLQYYFDGLLGLETDKQDESATSGSTALFIKTSGASGKVMYSGKIRTFDTRISQQPLTLYVQADQYYCVSEKTCYILFRLSPADYNQEIWSRLKALTLHEHICPD